MADTKDLGVKIENGGAYVDERVCVRASDFNQAAMLLASGNFPPGKFSEGGVLTAEGSALVEAAANAGVKWDAKCRRFVDGNAVSSYPQWGSGDYKRFNMRA